MTNLSHSLTIRFTADQYAVLKARAEAEGRSLGDVVRRLVDGKGKEDN